MLTPIISTLTIAVIFTIISLIDYNNIVIADDVERLPPINLSSMEHREFRGIKLANGLQAVLIRDDRAKKSAAAIVVAVGSMNDEKEQPGIANLVRYLLLAKCRKYRNKHEFEGYLKERGGKLGSEFITTETEHKHNFSFEVNGEFLEPTLKRFSQYFIEPLFEGVNDATLKEALGNSSKKHDRLMSADTMRTAQVLKSINEKDHPYNNLSYGTIEILNKYADLGREPVDEKLMNFVGKWYSANLMRLVVIANEKLDVLENMVATSFAEIANTGIEKLIFPHEQHPWKSDQLKHKICIVPAKDSVREIRLSFPVPDVLSQYKISPEQYAIQFINHGGAGTLGYLLSRKGLCKSKSIQADYQAYAGIGFFTIMMEPTKEGLKEVNKILELTFQYIHLLKNEGVNEWFYDEEKIIGSLSFKLWNSSELEIIQSLASAMHDYPVEDILSYKYIWGPWNAEPVHEFLSYLRPDNVNISVTEKSACGEGAGNIRTEPWYKTKYHIERIPDETIKKWESPVSYFPELKIPPRNEFIPDNIEIDTTNIGQSMPRYPYVIHTSPRSQIWYKADNSVALINIAFDIYSSIIHTNVMNGLFTLIFVRLLNISFEEYEYSAGRTANSWAFLETRSGFQIKMISTPRKFTVLLEKIMLRSLYLEDLFTEEDFEAAKKEVFDNLDGLQQHSKMPHNISVAYMSYLNSSGGFTVDEITHLRRVFQLRTLKKFVMKLLSRIHFQGLIYGNIDEQKAKNIANTIEEYFNRTTSRGMLPQEMLNLLERPIQYAFGKNFVHHVFSNSSKHVYHTYFPFGFRNISTADIRLHSICRLFFRIFEEACTKILPPRDTGSSRCSINSIRGIQGYVIVITSQMHPLQMDMRVEQFLQVIRHKLRNITETEFMNHKMEVLMQTIRLTESEDQTHLFNVYWTEIWNRTYVFQRHTILLNETETIERGDLIAFYKEFLAKRSPTRRKLTVYVYSNTLIQNATRNISVENEESKELENTYIEDLVEFKISSTALPPRMPPMLKLVPVL